MRRGALRLPPGRGEGCVGLFFSLDEQGYCINLYKNQRDLVREYARELMTTDIHRNQEDCYGLTMNMRQVGDVIHIKVKPILNAISADRFPINTFVVGRRRLA